MKVLYHFVQFLKVLPLPFTKILGQIIDNKKIPNIQIMKEMWSRNLPFWLINGLKFLRGKIDSWFFANHPAVHSREVAGGGSMALDVGISDM